MIEVRVEGILLDNVNNSPVVLLRERDGDRVLPIFIGPLEASAIAYALAPVAAGLALQAAIALGTTELLAYRPLFALTAVAFAVSWIPLRHFGLAPLQPAR